MDAKITLEAARINAGYTQKEAAPLFGIHYQTLAKLEDDSSDAPYSFIQAIPRVYKISPDNIFFGQKNEFIRLLRNGEFLKSA
jgi:DNA-binding XRE family transcriptional regulator